MIESQVINYILTTKDYDIIVLNNIDKKYFPNYTPEFEFINKHYITYGNVCDLPTFLEKFPEWEPIQVLETRKYLVDKLIEEYVYNASVPIIKAGANMLTNGDSRTAIDYVKSEFDKLNKFTGVEAVELYSDVTNRYEQYLDRVSNPHKYFITTGFIELDDILGGWDRNEDYVVVTARTNAGKSWWLTKFLNEAAIRDNITVGMYSGEMSEDKVGYRLDTLNSHISNTYLSRGREQAQKDYYNYQNKPINNKFYVCTPSSLGGVPTPQKLKAFVDKYHIQLLGIDQYSLLKDSNNTRSRNERFEAISMEIKLLQEQLKIPIIVVAQLNRSAAAKDVGDPGTDMIAGSDRIAQDATTVLSLKSGENGVIEIKVIKHRDGHVGDKLLYNWNADKGEFTYIPSEDDANKGAKCAEIHKSYNDEDEDCPF